jgi:tripartite-type tricarboxylate transporter receptor subunit TctC
MVGDHQVGRDSGKVKDVSVKSAFNGLLTAVALIAAAATAAAQDYPNRPITLVVGYAAGGGNDIMARVAAE